MVVGYWRQSLAPRGLASFILPRETLGVGKPSKSEMVTQLRSKDGDEELTALFQDWLIAFEKAKSATGDEETVALLALSRIELRIAATPAGLYGVMVKLGLERFLNEHADPRSEQLIPPTLTWYV